MHLYAKQNQYCALQLQIDKVLIKSPSASHVKINNSHIDIINNANIVKIQYQNNSRQILAIFSFYWLLYLFSIIDSFHIYYDLIAHGIC